ncbi:MAG: GNAT family N-acetyltransferase [Bifidobacteriaceae bacterium]|jgi:ribosomal protein S18 acetylase RimI-like enzyme|nr:GNAT family N-acetyltransferase [Bifidobacteriaceae bacterium]MCI1979162.1 GNAT family N-acetyltransferase [Bifidobacteriaceae bacterium]
MQIRRATVQDISGIDRLLSEVLEVHHQGRPDLFKTGARKYTDAQLRSILADDATPVFVAVPTDANSDGTDILGYAFCVFQRHPHDNILTDITTLYIDDLCVDESVRGEHVGSSLYHYVVGYAKASGCYNVTLNVWSCNPKAQRFYEAMGLVPYKIGMEHILS